MTELATGVPGPFPAPRTELSTADPGHRADQGYRAADPFEPLTRAEARSAAGQAAGQAAVPTRTEAPAPGDSPSGAAGRMADRMADRLRNNAELTADRGTTIIANEVVEKIVGIAARGVEGVYDLGGDVARVFAAVKERIGLGEADGDQGVSVRLDGPRATVKITLVIEYGFVVYSVTEKVRAKVIAAVENMLGVEVTAVDIVVDDVHVPDSVAAGAQARAAHRSTA
jgi:uncharacterized alkaline shock family protein YloU